MANLNELLPLVRTIFFAVVGVFSIIALGLSAHLVHVSNNFTPDWAGLGLATSILTLIALPTLFFVGIKRRGAIAAFVAVELVIVVILWVLWLATGADIASSLPGLGFCRASVCSEMRALEAFAFLNWLLLMFYSIILLVLASAAHSRGHRGVWKSQVNEFDWNGQKRTIVGVPA